MTERVQAMNVSLSRQINGSGGNLSEKELRLNDDTIVQYRGKYFMVRQDEPVGGWLELSLVVIDVNSLQVSTGKVELLKYGLANLRKSPTQQVITTARIKAANCRDAKLELSCNPTDPRTWYLVIHGTYERRVFVHQQIQSDLPESFKFYEYALNFPGFRAVRWTPWSRNHLFVLYKNKLEVVNYTVNLMQPELEIDLARLYSANNEASAELEYVDLGFQQGSAVDLSLFSVFLITKNKEVHVVAPVVLGSFEVLEDTFKKMVEATKNSELGEGALDFLYELGHNQSTRIMLDPTTKKLTFQVPVSLFNEDIKLNVIPIRDDRLATRGSWSRLHMVKGSKYPLLVVSERFGNEQVSRMQCYVYPEVIRNELNLEIHFHHLYEFQLPRNERIVSMKLAKEVKWNFPRIIEQQEGTLTTLCFNRLFRIDLAQLLKHLEEKGIRDIQNQSPTMSLLFESEVHVNKDPDEFDSGYYGLHVSSQCVASVRFYDDKTSVFQISPILRLDGSNRLREEIKGFLEGALKAVTKTLPVSRPKPEEKAPPVDMKEIKKISEPEQLLSRLNNLIEQSEVSLFRKQNDLSTEIKGLTDLQSELQLTEQKKREFESRIARIESTNRKIEELKRARCRDSVESDLKKYLDQIRNDHRNIQSIVRKLDEAKIDGRALPINDLLNKLLALRSRLKKLQKAPTN